MHLKVALHVHTTCSDGDLTIPEVVEVYAARGFDAIALTDHDHLLRPGSYDVVDSLRTELIVFKGVELTVFAKGYVHVNRIDGEEEQLHVFNHPAELSLPLDKVVERVAEVARSLPLDAVEITSKGFRTPEYDVPALPYPKVATDDAHTRQMCGRAWIELDCGRSKDAIIRAVRAGDFWSCYQD
jgi:predicted metal-dependent phosphoesterase TrpH